MIAVRSHSTIGNRFAAWGTGRGIDGSRRLTRGLPPPLHVEWCTRRDHAAAVEVYLGETSGADDLVDCVGVEIAGRVGVSPMF